MSIIDTNTFELPPVGTDSVYHFSGIGGIGMSGIAEILLSLGYNVSGSDIARNANVERLEKLGAKIFATQSGDNLNDNTTLVVSTAIKKDPRVQIARSFPKQFPSFSRRVRQLHALCV